MYPDPFQAAIINSDNAVQTTHTTKDPTGNKCVHFRGLSLGFALEKLHPSTVMVYTLTGVGIGQLSWEAASFNTF